METTIRRVLIAALFLLVPVISEEGCSKMALFLSHRKSNTIPEPIVKLTRSNGLLECVKNCITLGFCKSYQYHIAEDKCDMADEKKQLILLKIMPRGKLHTTSRPHRQHKTTTNTCSQRGYKFISSSMTCVKMYRNGKTWEDAMKFCQTKNNSLLVIKTEQKQHIIDQLFKSIRRKGIWIGARDKQRNDVFEWPDGSFLNFTAWSKSQPSHKSWFRRHDEDCVAMELSRSRFL